MLLVAVAGCGGDSPTAPADKPTQLAIQSATVATIGIDDQVQVSLSNGGGAGDYYLDFYGEPFSTAPIGCPAGGTCPPPTQARVAYSETVHVLAGYHESLTYTIKSASVSSVRVYSRPTNTAVYTRTGCIAVRSYGSCDDAAASALPPTDLIVSLSGPSQVTGTMVGANPPLLTCLYPVSLVVNGGARSDSIILDSAHVSQTRAGIRETVIWNAKAVRSFFLNTSVRSGNGVIVNTSSQDIGNFGIDYEIWYTPTRGTGHPSVTYHLICTS